MIILKILFTYIGNLLDVSFAILPILLIATLFHLKAFRKSPALQFLLLTVMVFFGWRTLFCFYNGGGISDRYIAVLPIILIVLAVPGIPWLSGWIVKLAAMRKIHLREQHVISVLLIIACAVCLGKALNPPDRKPYIMKIAMLLKDSAPADALLIDSTADGGRMIYSGDLTAELKGIQKYTRDKVAFFQQLKTAMAEPSGSTRKIYLAVRVGNADEFAAACKQEFGVFPFLQKYSCKIKRDVVILYEKIDGVIK